MSISCQTLLRIPDHAINLEIFVVKENLFSNEMGKLCKNNEAIHWFTLLGMKLLVSLSKISPKKASPRGEVSGVAALWQASA